MTTIKASANGPLLVDDAKIVDADGNLLKDGKVALCRCGASSNKPFCDGSHMGADFKA